MPRLIHTMISKRNLFALSPARDCQNLIIYNYNTMKTDARRRVSLPQLDQQQLPFLLTSVTLSSILEVLWHYMAIISKLSHKIEKMTEPRRCFITDDWMQGKLMQLLMYEKYEN